jgi:hypothetical protein
MFLSTQISANLPPPTYYATQKQAIKIWTFKWKHIFPSFVNEVLGRVLNCIFRRSLPPLAVLHGLYTVVRIHMHAQTVPMTTPHRFTREVPGSCQEGQLVHRFRISVRKAVLRQSSTGIVVGSWARQIPLAARYCLDSSLQAVIWLFVLPLGQGYDDKHAPQGRSPGLHDANPVSTWKESVHGYQNLFRFVFVK